MLDDNDVGLKRKWDDEWDDAPCAIDKISDSLFLGQAFFIVAPFSVGQGIFLKSSMMAKSPSGCLGYQVWVELRKLRNLEFCINFLILRISYLTCTAGCTLARDGPRSLRQA